MIEFSIKKSKRGSFLVGMRGLKVGIQTVCTRLGEGVDEVEAIDQALGNLVETIRQCESLHGDLVAELLRVKGFAG